MAYTPEMFGRKTVTDEQCAKYCKTLSSPLREDIACILWWDWIDKQPMPLTFALTEFYQQRERPHADYDDVAMALLGIGYTERRSKTRAARHYDHILKCREYRARKRAKEKEMKNGILSTNAFVHA